VTGAPSVEQEFALSHLAYAAVVFAGPLLIAAVLEAGVALVSDRVDRRRLVIAGQGGLAASLLMVAWTQSSWGLTIGLALAGATSGAACGAAQAILVASDAAVTGGASRAMVRWTFFAAIGDVLAPLFTAAALAMGSSYRSAMLAIAVLVAAQCVAALRLRAPAVPAVPAVRLATDAVAADAVAADAVAEDATDGAQPSEPLRVALARAARRSRLWVWLFAAASCTLLDELVVALSSLRLRQESGASHAVAAAAAATFAAGGVLGAALTDGLVARIGRRRVLVASGVLCALSVGALLGQHSALASCAALALVGVACAPHHALAMARAYEETPGYPGTVQACAQLFVVVDLVAPLALGLVADRLGLDAAFACLVVQPAVIIACASLAHERAQ
jgi:MFS family permease